MSFSPDPPKKSKQGWKKKRRKNPGTHPSLFFNNSLIEQAKTQKNLDLTLDQKLTFPYHLNKSIYKSFIRPHLDYSEVVSYQSSNDAFSNKLEIV